jgi:hypothetical protein
MHFPVASYFFWMKQAVISKYVLLLYVNDIPHVISDISNPILYADDSSLIITNKDFDSRYYILRIL